MRKMEIDSEDFTKKVAYSSVNTNSFKEIKKDPIASLDLGELQQEQEEILNDLKKQLKLDGTIDIEKLISENQDYIAHVFGISSIIIINR